MNRILKLLASMALAAMAAVQLNAKDYLATDFGAVGDGTTLNTASIQAAIDFISSNGGGRLVFTPGEYVSGTIYLKSNVTLHIPAGATLLGSLNPWDYIRDKDAQWTSLIFGIAQENIGITGDGLIDGRGFQVATAYVDAVHRGLFEDPLTNDRVQEAKRPEDLHFYRCSNITIKNITLKDSACWTQQYDQCKNILVDGVKVDAKSYWNNDGIDIVDCDGVVIRNCFFDAADDVYCFKSHKAYGVCQNVLVEDCIGRSSANGIKFGTYTLGNFKHFRFKNITIYDTYRSAFTIATVDGAQIEDIELDGLKSLHTGNPFFIRIGTRREREGSTPYLKDVVIKNVYAEVPFEKADAGYSYEGPVEDLPRNVCPSIIAGLPGLPVQNVRFENIEIVYPGNADPDYAYCGTSKEELDSIPELEKRYPEFSNWKELPAWGFYIRHAEGIEFDNVKVFIAGDAKDYRPAFVTDDVNGLRLKDVTIQQPSAEKRKKQIITKDTKNIKKK